MRWAWWWRGLVAAARESLRAQLSKVSAAVLVSRSAALTIDPTRLNDPEQATATALAGLARRVTALTEEITTRDRQLAPLVRQAAPRTSALFGVGTDVAAQLLTTAGDNPDRLRSEAALAHLCGAAPHPRRLRTGAPPPPLPRRRPRRQPRPTPSHFHRDGAGHGRCGRPVSR